MQKELLFCLGKLVSRYILIPEYFDCNLSTIWGIMDIDSLHVCKNQERYFTEEKSMKAY